MVANDNTLATARIRREYNMNMPRKQSIMKCYAWNLAAGQEVFLAEQAWKRLLLLDNGLKRHSGDYIA